MQYKNNPEITNLFPSASIAHPTLTTCPLMITPRLSLMSSRSHLVGAGVLLQFEIDSYCMPSCFGLAGSVNYYLLVDIILDRLVIKTAKIPFRVSGRGCTVSSTPYAQLVSSLYLLILSRILF